MSEQPLNIVLLMADQWRWDTIFQPDHVCQTPNLNNFAESGIVFGNAFTNVPLCCPARGSLLTGLWPHQTGLMDNVQSGSFYPHGQLHPDHKTYLERLRDDLGYALHYAGKWHIGEGTAADRGIQADISDGAAAGRRGEALPLPGIKGDALPPFYASFPEGKNRDQHAIEAGIAGVERLAQGERPFCSVISTWGPHFPHTIPQHYADLYADVTPEGFLPDNYCPPFVEEHKPKMQSKPY
jgi:arylsulfatase A-like enzyme